MKIQLKLKQDGNFSNWRYTKGWKSSKRFWNILRTLWKTHKSPKHQKSVARARETLQKFRDSVLEQMGALGLEPPPPLSKRDIVQIQRYNFGFSDLLPILRPKF